VGTLIVTDTQPRIEALRAGERDLREAGKVQDLVMSVGPEAEIEVRLDQGRDAGLTAAAERPT
jgi:hypothetical protein